MKKFKTTETATVDNYPYGYLKTQATFSLEWKKGKGFRTVFQTVNPKNGRINAPKKSTYSEVLLMVEKDNGHISYTGCGFNGRDAMEKGLKFMAENFEYFTEEQIKDIYLHIALMLRVDLQAIVAYCGANLETVKPLYLPSIEKALKGAKEGGNIFETIAPDFEAIEAAKVPDFQPFRKVEYANILSEGLSKPVVTQISDHDKRDGETIETIQAEETAKALIREVLK